VKGRARMVGHDASRPLTLEVPLQRHRTGRRRPARHAPIALLALLLGMLTGIFLARQVGADTPQAAFAAENQAAMDRMMAAMEVRPSGDVDRDFAATMIPHHQGAIDMAQAQLRYGSNEQLRRIAQEIIVEQQQEIAAMRLALGEPPPAPTPAPTQAGIDSMAAPGPQARTQPTPCATTPTADGNIP